MLIFRDFFETFCPVCGVGFTLVTAAQEHVCICSAATGLKPYYLDSQSCVIYGKHEAKAKKKSAELRHQHEKKKHWISSISVCQILGPL